tara:strand:- start:133 stop:759 length:627 start_codon:yes stop_codon:yes gene_type:complete
MAVYTITHKQIADNYGVLQLLTNALVQPGDSITVAAVDATFNGTRTVYACPQFYFLGVDEYGDLLFNYDLPIQNQVLFTLTASNVERTAATGTLTYAPTCTWVTAAQIEDWLGIGTATAADTTFLTQCASACNAFAFRRRQEAGYIDNPSTSPSGDITLGTIMLGGAYYRNRGSIDQFASFGDGGAVSVTGLSGMIKQLLGIDRPQVA